jgi:hypothetical protein
MQRRHRALVLGEAMAPTQARKRGRTQLVTSDEVNFAQAKAPKTTM